MNYKGGYRQMVDGVSRWFGFHIRSGSDILRNDCLALISGASQLGKKSALAVFLARNYYDGFMGVLW